MIIGFKNQFSVYLRVLHRLYCSFSCHYFSLPSSRQPFIFSHHQRACGMQGCISSCLIYKPHCNPLLRETELLRPQLPAVLLLHQWQTERRVLIRPLHKWGTTALVDIISFHHFTAARDFVCVIVHVAL